MRRLCIYPLGAHGLGIFRDRVKVEMGSRIRGSSFVNQGEA